MTEAMLATVVSIYYIVYCFDVTLYLFALFIPVVCHIIYSNLLHFRYNSSS